MGRRGGGGAEAGTVCRRVEVVVGRDDAWTRAGTESRGDARLVDNGRESRRKGGATTSRVVSCRRGRRVRDGPASGRRESGTMVSISRCLILRVGPQERMECGKK
jgi:hypothetical protein